MKKISKSEVAKAAKTATPATPAPSPVPIEKVIKKTKPAPLGLTSIVREAAPPAAPVVKRSPTVTFSTVIVAQIDVGFGNTLYLRGEGPGLRWDKGVPLDCVADDKWSISLAETSKPMVFKFLINDQNWCTGDDYVARPGMTVTTTPVF